MKKYLILLLIIFALGCNNSSDNDEYKDKWGINAHLPDDNTITLINEAGINWIRLSLSWALTEPAQGYRFWEFSDDRINAVSNSGLNIILTVTDTPEWASVSGETNAIPSDTMYFKSFMREVVERYGDRISYFGIWNEPNGGDGEFFSGTPQEYRDNILIPGANAVHDVSPNAKVVAPGITIHTDWEQWMTGILTDDVIDIVDIISVHLYVIGDPDDLFWLVDKREIGSDDIVPLGNVIDDLGIGSKEIWMLETGWATSGPNAITEEMQAIYYDGLLRGIESREIIDMVFTYEIIEDPEIPLNEPQFGIVRTDYTPKPAYDTYKSFIQEIEP